MAGLVVANGQGTSVSFTGITLGIITKISRTSASPSFGTYYPTGCDVAQFGGLGVAAVPKKYAVSIDYGTVTMTWVGAGFISDANVGVTGQLVVTTGQGAMPQINSQAVIESFNYQLTAGEVAGGSATWRLLSIS